MNETEQNAHESARDPGYTNHTHSAGPGTDKAVSEILCRKRQCWLLRKDVLGQETTRIWKPKINECTHDKTSRKNGLLSKIKRKRTSMANSTVLIYTYPLGCKVRDVLKRDHGRFLLQVLSLHTTKNHTHIQTDESSSTFWGTWGENLPWSSSVFFQIDNFCMQKSSKMKLLFLENLEIGGGTKISKFQI